MNYKYPLIASVGVAIIGEWIFLISTHLSSYSMAGFLIFATGFFGITLTLLRREKEENEQTTEHPR